MISGLSLLMVKPDGWVFTHQQHPLRHYILHLSSLVNGHLVRY